MSVTGYLFVPHLASTDMLDVVQCRDVPLRPYRAGIAFSDAGTAENATNL
jgi:hypothetical protein